MRILRLAAIIVAVIVFVIAALAAVLYFNQDRIVAAVLQGLRQSTGVQVTVSGSRLHLRSHLVVELDHPRIVNGSHELVKLARIRASIGYHALLFTRGLPLYAIALDNPDITVPAGAVGAQAVPLPQAGSDAVRAILIALHDLGGIAWRIEIVDGELRGPDGGPIADRVGMFAFRRHFDSNVWQVSFSAQALRPPFRDCEIAGHIVGGIGKRTPPHQVARGTLWYWNARLAPLTESAVVHAQGRGAGKIDFTLADDGSAAGSGDLGFSSLKLTGQDLVGTEALGSLSISAAFTAASSEIALHQLVITRSGRTVFSGDSELASPFSDNPEITIHSSAMSLDVVPLRALLRRIRRVPRPLLTTLDRVKSARMVISSASFTAPIQQLRIDPFEAIRIGLDFNANLIGASFPLPDGYRLPPVSNLAVSLNYADRVLTASQGSADLGKSRLSGLSARIATNRGLSLIDYKLEVNVDAAADELYPAAIAELESLKIEFAKRIASVGGRVSVAFFANGMLDTARPTPPGKYNLRVEPNHLVVRVKGTPAPVDFRRGVIRVVPGRIDIERIALATTGGDGSVGGELDFNRHGVHVRTATIELHQMQAGLWLALAIDPSDLSIDGPIGGKLELRGDRSKPDEIVANGRFLLAHGQITFGFLRSPMKVQGATIRFDKHMVQVALPSATLEGESLSLLMTVPDLEHPTLRIDADAQVLDMEALKFIRLPWSPATPPTHFPVPVSGHVQVGRAHLGVFPMTTVATDFSYNDGNWRVWNYSAQSFRGKINLDIIGRKKDDWIHIIGKIADIDSAPLFMLSGQRKESPVLGKMWVAGDLWADTDADFFQTLAGRISVTMRDGTINKFTMISRMLAFINLKSWLTANIPDPRVSGLPFKTIFMDLKGEDGVFWTKDFFLDGPVMIMTGTGNIDFAQSTLDMKFGLFPFTTVSWLVSKIPVVGGHVAGGTDLLAAYMHVHGKVSDPKVAPMPITSVAEFVKKTLGMPINIIRPNTIK